MTRSRSRCISGDGRAARGWVQPFSRASSWRAVSCPSLGLSFVLGGNPGTSSTPRAENCRHYAFPTGMPLGKEAAGKAQEETGPGAHGQTRRPQRVSQPEDTLDRRRGRTHILSCSCIPAGLRWPVVPPNRVRGDAGPNAWFTSSGAARPISFCSCDLVTTTSPIAPTGKVFKVHRVPHRSLTMALCVGVDLYYM